jgi:prevent-host-death family protein
MITVVMEQATLAICVREAQHGQVVVTRNGVPVALVVGIEGLDEEQVQYGSSDEFWLMIAERRRQKTVGRAELEAAAPRADPAT